jgi:hypothetical protein
MSVISLATITYLTIILGIKLRLIETTILTYIYLNY